MPESDPFELPKKVSHMLHYGNSDEVLLKLLPSNIPTIDKILGGGLAKGRMIEVVGAFSSGKTYFAQVMLARAQQEGLSTAFIDAERTYSPEWFSRSGVDVSKLIVAQPPSGELAADIIHELVNQKVGMVVLDSLAALAPTAELERDANASLIGSQARLIARLMREVTASNTESIFICINQSRANIGGGPYAPAEVYPGGHAPGFYAWQIMKVKRSGWITGDVGLEKGVRVGFGMEFLMEKNKNARAFQKTRIPFYYDGGLDVIESVLDMSLLLGIIQDRGNGMFWFADPEEKICRGRGNLLGMMREDKAFSERVTHLVMTSKVVLTSEELEQETSQE